MQNHWPNFKIDYKRKSSELGNAIFRRSLYFTKDLKAGDTITNEVVRSMRPGYGLAPKYLEEIIGKKVKIDIDSNTPVKKEDIFWIVKNQKSKKS